MRFSAGLLLLTAVLLGNGCVVVVATVATATAITATTVKTVGKVTTASVATTGKVAAAAMTSSGDVTALTLKSAARLARAGMVVLVDAGSGAVVELPWREGLRLQTAIKTKPLRSVYRAAKIFRAGDIIATPLSGWSSEAGKGELQPGDVVELLR